MAGATSGTAAATAAAVKKEEASKLVTTSSGAVIRTVPLTPSEDPPTLSRSIVATSTERRSAHGQPASPSRAGQAVRSLLTSEVGPTPAAGNALQADFVRSIVQSCLDEFRFALHRDVQNMHVELIRQFEIQKVSIWRSERRRPCYAAAAVIVR